MKRSFFLDNLRPFSINATYYGNGFVKTSAAREWAMEVFHRLAGQEQKFKELREFFDPKKHAYHVTMIANYPKAQFYTKQGLLSSKTFDLTNCEKGLIDLFWLPKHALSASPLGCQNLQMDDKYITQLISRKRATEDSEPSIEVEIEIVEL